MNAERCLRDRGKKDTTCRSEGCFSNHVGEKGPDGHPKPRSPWQRAPVPAVNAEAGRKPQDSAVGLAVGTPQTQMMGGHRRAESGHSEAGWVDPLRTRSQARRGHGPVPGGRQAPG